MRKRFMILATAAVTAAMAFALTACSPDKVAEEDGGSLPEIENGISGEIREMNITELDPPFYDIKDRDGVSVNGAFLCYASENTAVFAETRYDESEYSIPNDQNKFWWTSSIYVMDIGSGEAVSYTVNRPNDVDCAVPYKDGILYVADVLNDEETDSVSYDWQLLYNDGEKEEIVDSNLNYGGGPKPFLTLLNGTPVYVVSGSDSAGAVVSLMKLTESGPETIQLFGEYWTSAENNKSDGKHIVMQLYNNSRDDGTGLVTVYDENGVVFEDSGNKCFSAIGINGDYVLATKSAQSDREKNTVTAIPIAKDKEEFTIETENPMWHYARVTDSLTAMYSDSSLYIMDMENRFIQPCQTPEGFGGAKYLMPMSDGRFVFNEGSGYFIMNPQ